MKLNSEKRSYNEQRIREITFIYYSQPHIKKAIYDFSKDRECIARYYEGFGKRPDTFQYEQDIIEQVKRGATSFHCSEELWEDPLEISKENSISQLDELRKGWDLLLDIDSPYLEYSKIYSSLLVEALKFHGIKSMCVKFSGSKGFHIIVPWKAFPEKIYDKKTKDMFPEWPRIICQYLADFVQPKLAKEIFEAQSLGELARKTGRKKEDLVIKECLSCHRPASKREMITWICPYCKTEITALEGHYNKQRKAKCPGCRKDLIEKSRKELDYCEFCNIDSRKNPSLFGKSREKTEEYIEADLVLVAPRHLFRMPYSLHEKTSLASIVLDPEKIRDFQIKDANPLKAEIKPFYLTPDFDEAKFLLLQALDWKEQKDKDENLIKEEKVVLGEKKDYKKIKIDNPSEDLFPPQINLLLSGVKNDGRKRALFILLSFFNSIGLDEKEIEERINKWNENNYLPLKKGYIQSQLNWFRRNPGIMPPNFNNPMYRDIGVDKPDELAKQVKNPINYTIRKYFHKRDKKTQQI
jgi:DNA primase catalytic subunit